MKAIVLFLIFTSSVWAALPTAFQNLRAMSRVLPKIQRPTQETFRKVEDVVISVADTVITILNDFALESTLIKGLDLQARGEINENFFEKSSLFMPDAIFFREFLRHFPISYQGRGVGGKILISESASTFFEASEIVVDVKRANRQKERSDRSITVFTYDVDVVLKSSRMCRAQNWSAIEESLPFGRFRMTLFVPSDDRELILKGGFERKVECNFALGPFSPFSFPAPPLSDSFPLLTIIKNKTPNERVEALKMLADRNDPEALYLLGFAYESGFGGEIDLTKSLVFYLKGAQFQYSPAIYKSAEAFYVGRGVAKDMAKTKRHLAHGIELTNIWCLSLMGKILSETPGEEKVGREYLEYGAQNGNRIALVHLVELNAAEGTGSLTNALWMLEGPLWSQYAPAALTLGKICNGVFGDPRQKIDAFKWTMVAATWVSPPEFPTAAVQATEALLQMKKEFTEKELDVALRAGWERLGPGVGAK